MKMNSGYKIVGLSIVLGLSALFVIWSRSSGTTVNDNTLVVGMMSGWPPYMSIDDQGRPVGFDVDVAQALGKKLGKKVEIKDLGSLSTLFLALQRGKIDMIFSGLDSTQERQERMIMVPYAGDDMTSLYLVFYGRRPVGVASLEDLARISNVTVCVEANSTSDKFIDMFPAIRKKQLKGMADMFFDIRSGKSFALLAEPAVVRRLLKKDSALTYVEVPLPKKLCVYGCGIAIRKGNLVLARTIKKAIDEMRAEGKIRALEVRWDLKGDQK